MRHVRDLSQSERAQRYLDAEHAVAHALANASQLAEAAEQILETLCQTLAWDVGVLWLVDPQSHTIGCLELWHRPGITVDQFELASRRSAFPKGIGLPGRVWASGEPVWIFDVTCDDNFPRAAIANREGLHSAAGFPLDIGAELLGCIEFFTCRIRPPDEELLNLLASVSGLISQFIYRRRVEANLHKRQQEFELARRIQQRLLPKSEPGLDHFDIAAGCRPAQEVGGDFFDYLRLPDGRLGIGIGDASGHGIGAALTMAQACASLRTVALVHSDIQQMLTLLNRRLVDDTGGNGFLTLFLAALDPVSGELNYASGGHVPAYLFDGQGAIRQVLTSTGFPLATMADNVYPTGPTIVLHAGELLLLLTDGIVEAFSADGTMFGIERALAIVRTHRHLPAREIIAALWRELDAFSDGPQLDDMTAVILKVHEQV
jgi:serine phosphatase RsbU (regulator of sigma subunit)